MYYHPTQLHDLIHVDEIYTIHYFEYYKDYFFKGERHDFWELLYIDKGQFLVRANDRDLCLHQGQIIFHQPNEFHSVAANGKTAPNTIVISFSCNNPAMSALCGRISYVNKKERELLGSIISEAKATFLTDLGDPGYQKLEYLEDAEPGAAQMIRLHLETLLIGFIRKNNRLAGPSASATVQQNAETYYFDLTCKYIDDNIDSCFTLKHLSQLAMLSPSYLERLFNRFAGMSVIQYCNHRKIGRAKQLIREDRMNFSQIAESLGFTSIHYFSRIFKKLEGMAPREYGRSVKSLEDHSEKANQ